MERNQKISVTVVTGFLGAGKTTFINSVLKNNPKLQFALVENEFGDVSIDTKLIKGVDASQMFEMRQGCICCTITDEYELVLQELAERFPNVEHLLIETTGIADPAPVIRPFFADENLKNLYQYKRTVCLVDALHFNDYPDEDIALKQIAVAETVLISKTESLNEKQKNEFLKRMEKLNPLGKIFFSESYDTAGIDFNSTRQKNVTFHIDNHSHNLLETKTITFDASLEKDDFIRRFSYMLDVNKNNVYRAKGILIFQDEPYEFILQGVGGSFELTEGENFKSSEMSEIVLIGKLSAADLTF